MTRIGSSFFSRILPWVVLIHSLGFSLFWLTNKLFFASTNDFLADMIGRRLNYVSLLVWISLALAGWSAARMIVTHLKLRYRLAKFTAWLFGLVSLLYIAFFYGSFSMLFSESAVQLVRLGQLLGYFRFVLDTVILLGVAVGISLLARSYLRKRALKWRRLSWWPLILLFIGFGILWSLALVFPPDAVYKDAMPEKPWLIAHRGASMLAPENTMAAAELAAEIGVYGLETDVHISRDGQVFLLHDDTFERTTDIKTVFPGREKEPAENFTLAEIKQLNAGKWFVEQDPYGAYRKGLISPEQAAYYEKQAIPELADYLGFVREHNLVFRFDLKQPPQGNPYTDDYVALVLEQVRQAGIDSQIWFIVDPEEISGFRWVAGEMLATYGADYQALLDAQAVKSAGYQVVNVEYGISPAWIRQYQAAGLWVDVYTVDEPWQFSRLWLLGVDSVTTSNAALMAGMTRPILGMPYSLYVVLWCMVGLVGVGLVVGLIYPVINLKPAVQPVKSS
jgi:glycerophosphoryl diester phosphodiesterase